MWWRGNRELRLLRLHVCFTCPVSVSVCVQPLSVLSASGWCNARPSEAYVTTKAAKFFLNNFFISRCHTRCVARARHPILSLLSGDAREANPNRPRFPSPSSSPSSRPSWWRGCGPTRSWWTCCRTPGWSRGRGATGGTAGEQRGARRRKERIRLEERIFSLKYLYSRMRQSLDIFTRSQVFHYF